MKFLAAGALLVLIAMPGQSLTQGVGFESKPKSYVVYSAEPQTIPAGKSVRIELHFRVQDGFHVNSNTPKSDYLLPTRVEFGQVEGVKAAPAEYSPGTAYSFSFEPNEKLDVYTGAFTVKLPVVATAGEHKLTGTLRYQACDHAACYPPKTLPVEVLFTAK